MPFPQQCAEASHAVTHGLVLFRRHVSQLFVNVFDAVNAES